MKKYLITQLIIICSSFLFGQAPKIKSKNHEKLVFNRIDTLDSNTWVIDFEFWDRVDTVKYFENKKVGWISSYSKKGFFLWKKIFESKELLPPVIGIYYSEFRIKDSEILKGYDAQKLYFQEEFLTKRNIYYRDGRIKEEKSYRYGEKECTTITFEPETHKEIVTVQKCMDLIESGVWRWYDIFGKVTKEEDYRN